MNLFSTRPLALSKTCSSSQMNQLSFCPGDMSLEVGQVKIHNNK